MRNRSHVAVVAIVLGLIASIASASSITPPLVLARPDASGGSIKINYTASTGQFDAYGKTLLIKKPDNSIVAGNLGDFHIQAQINSLGIASTASLLVKQNSPAATWFEAGTFGSGTAAPPPDADFYDFAWGSTGATASSPLLFSFLFHQRITSGAASGAPVNGTFIGVNLSGSNITYTGGANAFTPFIANFSSTLTNTADAAPAIPAPKTSLAGAGLLALLALGGLVRRSVIAPAAS